MRGVHSAARAEPVPAAPGAGGRGGRAPAPRRAAPRAPRPAPQVHAAALLLHGHGRAPAAHPAQELPDLEAVSYDRPRS